MDPKLAFWTWAIADLLAVTACAALGVRSIRRGELRRHRRLMLAASCGVALFLLAYIAKVAFLGREDRGLWSAADLAVLYVHETCVAVMLVAGLVAGWRALRFRRSLGGAARLLERKSPAPDRVWHRRAGWTAMVACALGLATAAGVLAGMYARAAADPPTAALPRGAPSLVD